MAREGGSTGPGGSKPLRIGCSAISCLPNELRCCADTGKAWWSSQQMWRREVLWVAIWPWRRESLPSPVQGCCCWAGGQQGRKWGQEGAGQEEQYLPPPPARGLHHVLGESWHCSPPQTSPSTQRGICPRRKLCDVIMWPIVQNRKSNFKGERKYVENSSKWLLINAVLWGGLVMPW